MLSQNYKIITAMQKVNKNWLYYIIFATRINGHLNQKTFGAIFNSKTRWWFLMQERSGLHSLTKDGVAAEST